MSSKKSDLRVYWYILIILFIFYSGCDKPDRSKGFTIVSLSPAMTEIIYALGAEQYLAGITTFCDYPAQTKNIYKVGDFSNPSLERIVGLQPNLVIINLPEQARVKRELEKLDINVFISAPETIEDIYKEILEIGAIVDQNKKADSLVGYMKMHLTSANKPNRQRVYIELSPKPLVTIGAPSFLNELLMRAGAENIFAHLDKAYPVVSQEAVIKQNPDIIIVLHPVSINERIGWQQIKAVKNNKVYTHLNQDHLMRPGPRLVQGFEELKRIIDE
jgi:ABC-type Fe3+-hydroxamate transport system substrate-binding protein